MATKGRMTFKTMLIAGVLLALFAIAGTGLVAFTYEQTKDRIEEQLSGEPGP